MYQCLLTMVLKNNDRNPIWRLGVCNRLDYNLENKTDALCHNKKLSRKINSQVYFKVNLDISEQCFNKKINVAKIILNLKYTLFKF